MTDYKITIGLEIHLKIKSKTKIFCQCPNEQNFDVLMPNTNVCPVCTGQPGALPTLSTEVLEKSLLLGKALNCTINNISQFDRKSYFYPDLPMGYQITQLYHPTNTNGKIKVFLDNYNQETTIHILDAHMENDTAKMIHDKKEALIDFNRAGTPLVEVVTWPDFHTEDEVVEFLKELQRICKYNDISDAEMDKGQMRVDVNISISDNPEQLGQRVELKNINSFGMIKRAINHEFNRQKEILENSGVVEQQTRGRDDENTTSHMMRSKENALDYRYFPEPDLPPLELEDTLLDKINQQAESLTIPYKIIKTFKEDYQFHKEYINALINDKDVLNYFQKSLEALDSKYDEMTRAKTTAKRIAGPIAAYLKENIKTIAELPFTQQQFIDFLTIALTEKIMDNQMKLVMQEMLETWNSAEKIISEKGFDTPAIDNNELTTIIQEVIDNNPAIVQQYKDGKTSVIGFFVGQVMKATEWKANPQEIQKTLKEML